MHLCLYTDSVADLRFEHALDFATELGISAVEISAGGQSSAPHMNLSDLMEDSGARATYLKAITSRGLRLAAVNCSAWPLHPRHGERHTEIIKSAIRLASEFQVEKIVTMSGCPGDTASSSIINWITFPWPAQNPADSTAGDLRSTLQWQWETAVQYWTDMSGYAAALGISKIALELHPAHLVYNTPTLQRLRREVGPIIGANVDPSHMFWQQMDPTAVIRALGNAVHHVHLKDLEFNESRLATTGVLDLVPFEDPDHRSWIFRTVGQGHDKSFWTAFVAALRDVGYDDVLSIENEDPKTSHRDGVSQAAAFMKEVI